MPKDEFRLARMSASLEYAAQHLKAGHCVAMPTETVYGLAARVDSPEGIAAIFRLKERPDFDPLIVHVENLSQVSRLAGEWPQAAASLAAAFWPGPLTIVVTKQPDLNPMITSGLDTVGLRMPNHPVALMLIRLAGAPLAAPSANRFGRTSPTTADHVRSEFPEAVQSGEIVVLDGGESAIGVESTVCRVTESTVQILRPGGITFEALQAHFASSKVPGLKDVVVSHAVGHHASPGHTEHHYETKKPLIVSWSDELDQPTYEVMGRKISTTKIHTIELSTEPVLAARKLYSMLHEGDLHAGSEALFIRRDLTREENRRGLWRAIDDRLRRAARLQLGTPPAEPA